MLRRFTSTYGLLFSGILAALFAGFLFAVAGESASSPRVLPDALRAGEHEGPVLAWVITRDAYASCQQPAYVLRRIQQRYGEAVPLVVWYEEHERSDVQRILTRERLAARLLPLNARAYERWLGHPPVPALHLLDNDRLVKSWSYTRRPVQIEDVMALL